MTIQIAAWWIPAAITIIAIVLAVVLPEDDRFGVGIMISMVPALFVSMVAWILYAIFGA